jgi:hypothetical protein
MLRPNREQSSFILSRRDNGLIVFPIPTAGHNVRIGNLRAWFYLAVQGYIHLGKHGKFDWYGFRCAVCKALKVDIGHGFSDGQYFLRCPDCGYKLLCGDRL